jgi:hypothetical protein
VRLKELNLEDCIGLLEAKNRLGYKTVKSVRYLIQTGKLPNAIKQNNRWCIPINDIEDFEKQNINNQCLSTAEAMERLGYNSPSQILNLINNNVLPNSYRNHKKWWIPLSDIEELEQQTDPKKFLSAEQAAKKLGYSKARLLDLIRKKRLPNSFQDYKKQWRIPFSDIHALEKLGSPKDCLNAQEAANRLGYSHPGSITTLISRQKFPHCFQDHKRKWWIPLADIEAFEKKRNSFENCLNTKDAAKRLNYKAKETIVNLIAKNNFPNACKDHMNTWWIPMADIETFEKERDHKPKKDCNTKQAAKKLGYTNTSTITVLISEHEFPNAIKDRHNNQWLIPVEDIIAFKKEKDKYVKYQSIKEAAKKTGKTTTAIQQAVKRYFPNAVQDKSKRWWIPSHDIEEFQEKNKKREYNGKVALTELLQFIDENPQKNCNESIRLFKDYVRLQFNKISGTTRYIRDRFLTFKSLYSKLFDNLGNEIFFLSKEEVNKLLQTQSPLNKSQKVLFTRFLRYCYSVKEIKKSEQLFISVERDRASDYIYPPDLFYRFYEHTKKIDVHLLNAIKDRHYANMWAYSILLLTDLIRANDLILQTPKIDLENIDIDSFDWLSNNTLSEIQAYKIITQLYIWFRNKRTSKTDELLTFIVSPDLVLPLANALVISELHRRLNESDLLLGTFIQGKFDSLLTSGNQRHHNFFKLTPGLESFDFKSRIMNRSVATYLFYSITEEAGEDSDLSLYMVQSSRSHKSPDSTSIYIQSTNKDGSINRVSFNLFRRGHFGWLYNYLIMYAFQKTKLAQSLEERTKMIEHLRKELSPSNAEGIGHFFNNHLTITPYVEKKSMEEYLNIIYTKRRSVVSRLKDYTEEEIKHIILKISEGKMPSKNENAQCLLHPECKYPGLSNCFSCEYVIPRNFILIELKNELTRLLNSIEASNNRTLITRDAKFLLHVLLIWREARISFGDEIVSSFIAIDDTWDRIKQLAHKLPIHD